MMAAHDRERMRSLDARTLRILEFDKIRKMLMGETASSLGRELAENLSPGVDLTMVRRAQRETSEARRVTMEEGGAPLGGLFDVREAVHRAKIGGVLGPEDLLRCSSTMLAARRLKKFLSDLDESYEVLKDHASRLDTFRDLEERINHCITDEGEVADGASPLLASLRARIRAANSRIREKLESMIRSSETLQYLQDPVVTIRNDRFVVPVKAEARAKVPGIVHDQSQSGATVFVEPMAVVQLNNELRELMGKEEQEVFRILSELSGAIGQRAEDLAATLDVLARIDFAFAKARLSLKMDAVEPALNIDGIVRLKKARHPLLSGRVVPIDPYIGDEFTVLVITGPNTGGKTVTLKTVGVMCIMASCGLHVPCDHGTEIALFEDVLADIGDEQSIEQSLSTFSSHMTRIIDILGRANERTLVLLDELGAGTDPTEGASLAMAILEHLLERKVRTVATTHYSELKVFAMNHQGVRNASVEFDVETLRPTYRLIVGLPGKSNAFAIAERLGLPKDVLDRAREMLSSEEVRLEDVIANLQESRRATEEERARAAQARVRLESLKASYEQEVERLKKERSEILKKARDEAGRIIAAARRELDQAIADVRAAARSASVAELEEVIRRSRARFEGAVTVAEKSLEAEDVDRQPAEGELSEVKPGDHVVVRSLGQTGTVVSGPNAQGEVTVQMGLMRVTVKMADLSAPRRPRGDGKTGLGPGTLRPPAFAAGAKRTLTNVESVARQKAESISTELDLRGLTVEEALEKLDKYLDDALLAGIPKARIIHGKGTGALRQAVREALTSRKSVSGFRYGEAGEGGDGVTVVTFANE